MAVTLSSLAGAGAQFFDNNGVPLAGGLIYTYTAGTTTPAATYTSSTGLTAHTNPIVLNAAGRIATGEVWLTSGVDYKFIVQTALFVQLGSYDNIPSVNDFTSIYAALANTSNVALGDALIGFKQSNSSGALGGAVGRTVHQKLQESVSVKDFGAVGDGSTNDAAAIQAAVAAAGYGGSVYFPKGSYRVNSAINVSAASGTISGVNFVGEGPSTRIVVGASGLNCVFNITGTNSKFTNLTIDANSTDVANGFFVNIGNLADIGSTIQECTIIGFPVGISGTGQNHYYENNFFLNNVRHIKFTDDGRNTSISGNYMLGGSYGIVFETTSQQAEGTRIINNTILVTVGSGAGIEIQAGLEITLLANIIDQTGVGSVGINLIPSGGNAISSIKMTDNWIAAGQGSYGVFANGNNTELHFNTNTFVSNNSLITLSAINLTNTNTYGIIDNRFLMTYSGATQDIVTSGTVNSTLLGNSSSLGTSVALLNRLNSRLSIATDLIVDLYVYAAGLRIGTGGSIVTGNTGDPNGVLTALTSSIYMRYDGGVGAHIYVCQGGTVWTAIPGV